MSFPTEVFFGREGILFSKVWEDRCPPGRVLKKFNLDRLRHEVRSLTLLYTILGRKDTLFVHLALTNFQKIPNRKYSYFHAAFTNLKEYRCEVCVFEIF